MRPLHVGALAMALAGCEPTRPVHRTYHTAVYCSTAFREDTAFSDTLALLDADGDLRLTASDLRRGEAAAVARVVGDHAETDFLFFSQDEFTAHTDWSALVRRTTNRSGSSQVELTLDCKPTITVSLAFRTPDPSVKEPIEVPLSDLEVHVVAATARGAPGEAILEGALEVHLGDVLASGSLTGSAASPLVAWEVPDDLPYEVAPVTGQVFELHALAFRDIGVVD